MTISLPWEHPHWYDLHDTSHSAGAEREPEHYRELLLALPPLGHDDHLVDLGAGTGKLALLIAKGYPGLGKVTLVEPNADKLLLAHERVKAVLPEAQIAALGAQLGGAHAGAAAGTVVTIGSVLMPVMMLRGGTLSDGLAWLRTALKDALAFAAPGGGLYILETLALPWDTGGLSSPVRRLNFSEMQAELRQAGLSEVECVYRFRDRVVFRGYKGPLQGTG
jgi:SAM-dependent methyltransferase